MASLVGFEPTTRCLEGSRSILLSYRDVCTVYHVTGATRSLQSLSFADAADTPRESVV
jgi:hypothetical protein